MTSRTRTMLAAAAVALGVLVVPSALGAYTTARLEVRQAGASVTIKATVSPNDDPTAGIRIVVPSGTQLTTSQAPGTVLGPVRAVVKALDLGGADLPLEGQLVVAAPGQIAPASRTACLEGATPLASWVLVLGAAGQTLPVPAYLIATTPPLTAFGPAYIQVCLPPPDIPSGATGRATFGAKLYSAELTLKGVFAGSSTIPWIAFWTPYRPGLGEVNAGATVLTPAVVAPGAVTIAARKAGKGAVLSGKVTQGVQPRAGAAVTIQGGARARSLRKLGSVKTGASGSYTFRAKTGTFFRATVTAAPGSVPQVCAILATAFAPVPCLNPTTNGFTAQTEAVKRK